MEKNILFKDRQQAAESMAILLQASLMDGDAIAIGLNDEGAAMANYIGKILNIPSLELFVQKLTDPQNKDHVWGAVCEEEELYEMTQMAPQELESYLLLREKSRQDIHQKIAQQRAGEKFPDLTGKNAILITDGIKSGASVVAAIHFCKSMHAKSIVVAAPVALRSMDDNLDEADLVLIPNRMTGSYDISDFYA
ncbi:putative phosphoribosyltransferase [Chitinophaga dinghuensis]|uniref:Putative phosphoribosyltransferase n=1 Tax=Chitinophaga dinghuensis TaxID=1539050 RepID=A0A327VUQ3_9BACT|nr:phosphoribosyltransferase family protein [Chitinophaga dinghuensis]RAJ79003.1 putative phosphoribosyltransferase [Chitinophaga dinghuensis]